ncbi:MAG: lipid-A-disaccharide synthase [bacterium]
MGDLLLVTGDISGDNYAARLTTRLQEKGFKGRIYAAAGPKTECAGARLVENLVEHTVIGFTEIIGSLPYFFRLLRRLEKFVVKNSIDRVVFIDFPGFNLRLASRLEKHDVKLIYYITPQVWAWGEKRVSKLERLFDELLVIFPFEKKFFEERGVKARFVGHPLVEEKKLDSSESAFAGLNIEPGTSLVSFFPGSRRREVERHLPVMLEAARNLENRYQGWRFVFSAASSIGQGFLEDYFSSEDIEKFYIWNGPSRGLLEDSRLAVLASGTVTMEAAFAHTPMIVGYKTSRFSYLLGRLLARIDKAAMPNILSSTNLAPELIQSDFNVKNLIQLVSSYIENPEKRETQVEWLKKETEIFAGKKPTDEVAKVIISSSGPEEDDCEGKS